MPALVCVLEMVELELYLPLLAQGCFTLAVVEVVVMFILLIPIWEA
jgi:hypothetical protein